MVAFKNIIMKLIKKIKNWFQFRENKKNNQEINEQEWNSYPNDSLQSNEHGLEPESIILPEEKKSNDGENENGCAYLDSTELIIKNICKQINSWDELCDEFKTLSASEIIRHITIDLINILYQAGAEEISNDTKFNIQRHFPLNSNGKLIRPGSEIERTEVKGLELNHEVLIKAKIILKN